MGSDLKSQSWRLINTGILSGYENMALDEALLESFDNERSDPVLRIYGWYPSTLSLGRFQSIEEVLDLERCQTSSVPIVRRISGGGVIYHADELTYSIVCSQIHISAAQSVKDTFRVLTGFLMDFYHSLGLNASYAADVISDVQILGSRTPFCFAGKEAFDILINGRKIGGNAQRRLKNSIFQHGSIPIINRAKIGLEYMRDRFSGYAESSTSLHECGVYADVSALNHKLIESFARNMSVNLTSSQLSQDEQQAFQRLLTQKYSTENWNFRGELHDHSA